MIFSNSFFDNLITDNLGCLMSPMLCKVGSALICLNETGVLKVFIGLKSIASQCAALIGGS